MKFSHLLKGSRSEIPPASCCNLKMKKMFFTLLREDFQRHTFSLCPQRIYISKLGQTGRQARQDIRPGSISVAAAAMTAAVDVECV